MCFGAAGIKHLSRPETVTTNLLETKEMHFASISKLSFFIPREVITSMIQNTYALHQPKHHRSSQQRMATSELYPVSNVSQKRQKDLHMCCFHVMGQ